MSPDLTQQHRPQRSADHGSRRQGADGLEARRRRLLQQHHHDQRIAGRAGHRLGRHQRRQRAGQPRRRPDAGRTSSTRCPACRRRRTSRASRRRRSTPGSAYVTFDGHRTDDHKPYVFVTQGLRRDLDVDRGQPADGQRQRDHRRHAQPQPAVPRHRVRDLRVARRRQGVEARS